MLTKTKQKSCIVSIDYTEKMYAIIVNDIYYIDRLVFLDFKLITNSSILPIWVLLLQGNSTVHNNNFVQWHHFFGSAIFATIRANYTTLCRLIFWHLQHVVAAHRIDVFTGPLSQTAYKHSVCFLVYSTAAVPGKHPRYKRQLQSVFPVLISARILRFIGFSSHHLVYLVLQITGHASVQLTYLCRHRVSIC